MRVSMRQLLQGRDSLSALYSQRLPVIITWRLMSVVKMANEYLSAYNETVAKVMERYREDCKNADSDTEKLKEASEFVNKSLADLLAEEVTFPDAQISADLFPDDARMSGADMTILNWLISPPKEV